MKNFHIIVVKQAEDIIADNSRVQGHSPRTSTIIAIISAIIYEVKRYNYYISYMLIP